jgi:hypothetical protein
MHRRRWLFSDTGWLIVALIVIVITAVVLPRETTEPPERTVTVQSDKRSGAMALRLWLEALDYQMAVITGNRGNLADLDALFVLMPDYPYTPEDAAVVANWVAQGHTLIVANTDTTTNSLLAPYGVSLTGWSYGDTLSLTSPALSNPPFDAIETIASVATISTRRSDVAIHLVSETGDPVAGSVFYGRGIVWIVGTVYPFTNEGLHESSSASLILNLLASVPEGASIGFDETLNLPAQQPEAAGGLTNWLVTSRAGWSIAAAAALIMGFLLLRGRRFGQPVPIGEEHLRREPVEFIVAMAHLTRRAGHRAETLRQYRLELQRFLARRYGIDPTAPPDELIRFVALHDPALDTQALADLLRQLSRKSVSEQELVRLALAVHTWIGDRD